MNALTPFDFEGRAVRVVEDEAGVPWFVALDVCECLGIRNHRDTVSRLDDDEVASVGVSDVSSSSRDSITVSAVNEPGVYKLCFRSNKPEAKRLVRWLTHEVLPSLRRTGRYEVPDAAPEPPPVPKSVSHHADVLVSAARGFNALIRAGRTAGMSRVRAVRQANEATVRATGIDLIDELDAHDIIAPTAELAAVLQAGGTAGEADAAAARFVEGWRSGQLGLPWGPALFADAHAAYTDWAADNGAIPLSPQGFSAPVLRCGLRSARKRWRNGRVPTGPNSTLLPRDVVRPAGITETDWLGNCFAAFRAALADWRDAA